MSIVRVGLSQNKGYTDGYDAIFGKKESGKGKKKPAKAKASAKKKGKKAKKK